MRAALYARFSSDLQKPKSVADQIAEGKDFIAAQGWTLTGVFTDAEMSGTTMIRPGLQAVLAEIERSNIDALVFESLDRLSRDLSDTAHLFKLCTSRDVAMQTWTEGKITLLHVGMKGTMNAQFIADLVVKIRRGQRGNITRGLSAGGLTYGYEVLREFAPDGSVQGGRRGIREDQAEVVRRIFADYIAGQSPVQIARALNREGIPSFRKGLWRASSIGGHRQRKTGILHNELYIGVLSYGRTRKVKDPFTGRELNRLNPESQWKRQSAPELRIIDDATWEAAQAMKLRNGGGPKPQLRKSSSQLLSGLIVCSLCGAPYTARDGKRLVCRGYHYEEGCTNARRVRRDWIEARVLDEISASLSRRQGFAEHAQEYHRLKSAQGGARRAQHRAAVKELGDVRAKIGRLVESIASGSSATPAAVTAAITALEVREKVLTATIAELADDGVVKLEPNAHRVFADNLKDLRATLTGGTPQQQSRAREILRGLIERVEIIPVTDAEGHETFEWVLVGKLAEFLRMAVGSGPGLKPPTGWGVSLVRVEEIGQLPPPLVKLRFKA